MATLTLTRQSWDEEPLQDVGRCLEHLLTIIIRTVEAQLLRLYPYPCP